MDHITPQIIDYCEAAACTSEATHAVTLVAHADERLRRLCGTHAGESLRTALMFGLGHRSTLIHRSALR